MLNDNDWALGVLWNILRGRYETMSSAFVSAARELHRAGQHEDAERMIAEVMARYPDDPWPVVEHAEFAYRRQDWALATRRFEELRRRFPDNVFASLGPARIARDLGNLDTADRLFAETVEQFPQDAGAVNEWAHCAHRRKDLAAALSRWAGLRAAFPNNLSGYVAPARALREAGQLDTAEALLAAAVGRFPNEALPLMELATIAEARKNWDEASRRWSDVLARSPRDVSAHLSAARSRAELGRLDEADNILADAQKLFPENPRILIARAESAARRPEQKDEAFRRWRLVYEQFPDMWQGYARLADALRGRHDYSAADAIMREALRRFPDERQVLHGSALLHESMGRWAEARQTYEHLLRSSPIDPNFYAGIVRALIALTDAGAAASELAVGRSAFPSNPSLKLLAVDVALARGAADEAAEIWRGLHAAYLNDRAVQERLHQQRHLILGFGVEPDVSSAPASVAAAETMQDIVLRFESLGGTHEGCEFGIFQRHYGAEPLGLLRWAENRPEHFMLALQAGFEGVGTPEQTTLEVDSHKEYMTHDRKFGMRMHTFIYERDMPPERMLKQVLTRLRYLKGKFLEDLKMAEKIFVYKTSSRPLSDEELQEIFVQLRRYGPVTLLYVRREDQDNPFPHVRWAAPGLMIGYMDKFSYGVDGKSIAPVPDSWAAVVRNAYGLWRNSSV